MSAVLDHIIANRPQGQGQDPRSIGFAICTDGVLLKDDIREKQYLSTGASCTLEFLRMKKIPFVLVSDDDGYARDIQHILRRAVLKSEVKEPGNLLQTMVHDRLAGALLPDLPESAGKKGPWYKSLDEVFCLRSGPLHKLQEVSTRIAFDDVRRFDDRPILMLGGHGAGAAVLSSYGFGQIVEPAEVVGKFSIENPATVGIAAIFVLSGPSGSPADQEAYWKLIIELLVSQGGKLGTISPLNANVDFHNAGWLMDGQPPVFVVADDFARATDYQYPVFDEVDFGLELQKRWADHVASVVSDPTQNCSWFDVEVRLDRPRRTRVAEKALADFQRATDPSAPPFDTLYMVTDHPRRDLRDVMMHHVTDLVNYPDWKAILIREKPLTEGEQIYHADHKADDLRLGVLYALLQFSPELGREFTGFIANW